MKNLEKEEYIESDILDWLHAIGVNADKIVSEGYFDTNRGIYRQRKSRHIKPGIADIIGCMPNGRYLAIEVKKPGEMSFFDRTIDDLKDRLRQAEISCARGELKEVSLKKYRHAVEQRLFLDGKSKLGGIAFFASSIEECIEKFREYGVFVQ